MSDTDSVASNKTAKLSSDVNVGASTSRVMDNQPGWNDPSLLADIKAATGVDLSGGKNDGRKANGKKSNLTSLKKITDNSRNRLEKKVMNKYVFNCRFDLRFIIVLK